MLMNAKEEELNSIIMELQTNYATLQEKFTKEETDKLVRSKSTPKSFQILENILSIGRS